MSEVKHTPGPWAVEYGLTNDPEKYTPGIDAKHGFSILMFGIKSQNEECGIRGRTIGEQEANARLIAAAPELLGALQAMLNITDFHELYGNTTDRARAAIAKATGGQP